MKSFLSLAIGVALLWSTTITAEENNQQANVTVLYEVQYVEDQASPGKWYTCIQVFLGALMSETEMTTAWVELIKQNEKGEPYVFARHGAVRNVSATQVTLLAFFPGIHKEIQVATGFDLKHLITDEKRRIQIGNPLPLKEMDANIPIKMIPLPESGAPATPKPETPAPKEKKSPSPRPPRKSIDGDFLQVLIG